MSNLALRLKSARVMNGLTLESLASKMENAVSKQALQQYESGARNPSLEVLRELSKSLNVRPDYFLREHHLTLGEFKFRKQSKLGQKWQDAFTEKVRSTLERYFELEEILNARQTFKNPLTRPAVSSEEEAEAAAQAFRTAYSLGTDPILNVLEMLESIGIKVVVLDEVPEFDGVSSIVEDEFPIIVVNKRLVEGENAKPDRLRFTALHELAHLVLKIEDCEERQEEKFCHAFAGAFLLPESRINEHFGSVHRNRIYMQELINVKGTYGISIRAILMRLRRFDRISEYDVKTFFAMLNRQYGAKNEPGHCPNIEKPFRFEQLLFRALAEELISTSKAAELLGISLAEFRASLSASPA
jgi:Zn-dependent peptidase ImmA (M78 family)/DNA-binding XRE family transcriptional regulator